MLKGHSLSRKSKIGIIAPASCEKIKTIKNIINNFSSLGFNLKLGKHIYDNRGFFAGSDKDRASDIMDMFLDSSIDGIICLRGGYGSIRTIPYLNKDIIINNPKFFCGYSDITILLNYFSSLGLIAFHGPMINSNFNDKITHDNFLNIISYNKKNFTYDLNDYNHISYYNKRSFSGIVAGGNLAVICSAIGTPWQINMDNSILLLEEVNEYPYALHRMLNQLINCNLLRKCSGIIIGYLSNTANYNNSNEKKILEQTIVEILSPLNIPLLVGFPSGHNYPNLTIPIGSSATFISDSNLFIFNDNFLN